MDELFGITDDLIRIMDENQRERAASRTVPRIDGLGLDCLCIDASTLTSSGGASEKRNTVSSRSEVPPYRI